MRNAAIPTLEKLRKKYKISRVILVADSGLINKDNVDKIAATGLEYIIGARLKNSTKSVITEALKSEGYTSLTDNSKGKTYTLINKKQEPTISKHIGDKAKKQKINYQELCVKKNSIMNCTSDGGSEA